jgi:heme/copper-type cytochrome/quinol oxidase subunit 3
MTQAHAVSVESIPTGIPSGKLGMWLFLASEVMFFTTLIAAYVVLKMGHPAWPGPEGHLSVPLGTLNTFLLICSSTTIVLAMAASEEGKVGPARRWLVVTMLLGACFLGIKAVEYGAKFSHHILPSTNVFWSCYFTMTGLHALHVFGGIVFNLWILAQTMRPAVWVRQSHFLELGGLYWHFVDIVWIFLFPLLYLLS